MTYIPREGVDYLVDLYQIAQVEQGAGAKDIERAINGRLKQYHPDRLEGLAPEFKEKGERMARLLNRAKVILTDADKRSEYDTLLQDWTGPLSSDGAPTATMDAYLRARFASMEPEELEASLAKQRTDFASTVSHDPAQQSLLERLYQAMPSNSPDAAGLRQALDAALLAEDQVLTVDGDIRSKLLVLPTDERHEASLDYVTTVRAAIEAAREKTAGEFRARALGGVSTRLALLAGESAPEPAANALAITTDGLPHYFEAQAEAVTAIAAKRQEILQRRLDLFEPEYPIQELQTEAKPNFAIGLTGDFSYWFGFHFDAAARQLTSFELPDDIKTLLAQGLYPETYSQGYNLLTIKPQDHIPLELLLEEAYNKHVRAFFPQPEVTEESM